MPRNSYCKLEFSDGNVLLASSGHRTGRSSFKIMQAKYGMADEQIEAIAAQVRQ
jgi:hypothetical protein